MVTNSSLAELSPQELQTLSEGDGRWREYCVDAAARCTEAAGAGTGAAALPLRDAEVVSGAVRPEACCCCRCPTCALPLLVEPPLVDSRRLLCAALRWLLDAERELPTAEPISGGATGAVGSGVVAEAVPAPALRESAEAAWAARAVG